MECYLETMVKQNVKCCACEGSLAESEHLNIAATNKVAAWEFPASCNVYIPEAHNAVAIICDRCVMAKAKILFAIESDAGWENAVYHPIEELEDDSPGVQAAKVVLARMSVNPLRN